MSPEEVFAHAKALWPTIDKITRTSSDTATVAPYIVCHCDWPDGMIRFPPEPPKYRGAQWPKDAESPPKKARFKQSKNDEWNYQFLAGRDDRGFWFDNAGARWTTCEVLDEENSESLSIQE
jgi:hypothetical protein